MNVRANNFHPPTLAFEQFPKQESDHIPQQSEIPPPLPTQKMLLECTEISGQLFIHKANNYLVIRKTIMVPISTIYYVEAKKDYMHIYHWKGETAVHCTMKNFAKALASNELLRVHKSFAVARRYVVGKYQGKIYLRDQKGTLLTNQIPIGKVYKDIAAIVPVRKNKPK